MPSQKILVVDDQEAVRNFLSECLGFMGYETITASSADEAIDLYLKKSSEIGLIITDMTMPKISGIDLANRLYETNQEVRIILTTGYNTDAITEMPPSIVGIVAKPYNIPDFSAAVEKALQPAS